jgi:aspartyl-tRNA(Asn)/glutamyl-tRNA(Gln) amidotransferase subunit A
VTEDKSHAGFCSNRREVLGGGLAAAFLTPAGASAALSPDALTALSAAQAAQQIRSGTLTSAALTQAYLARTAIYNPKLSAIITVAAETALATAAACDTETREGHRRGPLHGVPILIKDNIDTAGIRTTAASLVYENRIPDEDAEVVRRLASAGAVMIGKTNLHEFAGGITSASSYFGPIRNPWMLDRDAGGSSSGSAAGISADLACAAIGTDTAGSVRAPASYCSIVGLKPTYGLVPIRGIVPLAPSFDHCGPMTKTVEDAALLLNVLAGYDSEDITSVEHPAEDYVAALAQPIDKLRFGTARRPFFDLLDPDVAVAMDVAITALGRLMVPAGDVRLPDTIDFLSLGTAEIEAYHLELYRSRSTKYGLHFRNILKSAFEAANDTSQQSAAEKMVAYVRASWQLRQTRRDAARIFTQCDIVALPTMRKLPRPLNEMIAHEEKPTPREPEVIENCFPFNVLGLPAISVPAGFSGSGLPIGLMLVGPPFSEGRLLAVAHAFERSTAWHLRKPSLRPGMITPSVDWPS